MGPSILLITLFGQQARGIVVLNSAFSSQSGNSCVRVEGSGVNTATTSQPPGEDSDLGPYCYVNSTSNTMMTGIYASSGFLVTNAQCRSSCSLAGCTIFRETGTSSGNYSRLSQCLVAESFHYSAEGSMNETWCPHYDYDLSVFSFKGRVYKDQWYWLGWPSRENCMNAILCGPSSHYFDTSQTGSNAWCQPTPVGWYSEACSNAVSPCISPEVFGDMSTSFWTSHGFGSPTGCGVRQAALAFITGFDTRPLSTSFFHFEVDIALPATPFLIDTESVILGVFLVFFLALKFLDPSSAKLVLFHREVTLFASSVTVESPSFTWYPGEVKRVGVSVGGAVEFFVDSEKISSIFSTFPSTRSLGSLSIPGIPANFTDGSMVHVGPFFASEVDFVGGTVPRNPYEGMTGLDFDICNLVIRSGVYTSTTSSSTTTSSTSTSAPTTSTTTSTTTSLPPISSESPFLDPPNTTYTESSLVSTLGPPSTSLTTFSSSTPHTSNGQLIGLIICVAVVGVSLLACVCWKIRKSRKRKPSADGSWVCEISALGPPHGWEMPTTEIFALEQFRPPDTLNDFRSNREEIFTLDDLHRDPRDIFPFDDIRVPANDFLQPHPRSPHQSPSLIHNASINSIPTVLYDHREVRS